MAFRLRSYDWVVRQERSARTEDIFGKLEKDA
jgi:hypothetical protein